MSNPTDPNHRFNFCPTRQYDNQDMRIVEINQLKNVIAMVDEAEAPRAGVTPCWRWPMTWRCWTRSWRRR